MNNPTVAGEETEQPSAADARPANPFRYVVSPGFAGTLERLRGTLLLTTYQAGKLMAVRAHTGRVSTLLRTFDRPMGLALTGDKLALGTRNAVWFLRNARDIAPQLDPPGAFDACFTPRQCHITGDILGHEMSWGYSPEAGVGETPPDAPPTELWVVNTRFSCLCTLHPDYSFIPRWRPSFVSALAAEDRCHLNGLAMVDGQPRFVTALGRTDTPRGWKPGKADGGVLIDVPTNEIVADGFAMPHSPRWHAGRLWVLDSGQGELQVVDPKTGQRDTVVRLPGYTRGLVMHEGYAFVGLSRIREKAEFGGLPIETSGEPLQCGIWIVDLRRGVAVEFMAFEAGCDEVFAVEVLPGIRWPAIIGFKQETIDGIFIVPPT
ncbi:MAG: TIGR03032 family protein [Accumulibacter sp.]|uniref:TIGR03032 family protein n=1 Tax=Accumulibacter sp. TaxID=2053492 RepID=UPI002FC350D0